MLIALILGSSILFQLIAAVLAIRLIRSTGLMAAWLFIAAALVLMSARRGVTLYQLIIGDFTQPANFLAEFIALSISILMLFAMVSIRPFIISLHNSRANLRAGEAKYRGILDNMLDTYYRADNNGLITMTSNSVFDLLGYSSKELMGKNLGELYVHPSGRDAFLKLLADQGYAREYEALLRTKDGSCVLVETNARYVRDETGCVLGVEGVARNITERKYAENLNARLGHIIENSTNEVYVFDSTTLKFIFTNYGARRNLGYTLAELNLLTPVDIKPQFTSAQFFELIQPLRDGSVETLNIETDHIRKDGSIYPVEVLLQLSKSEQPPVFFAIIQDLTERKQADLEKAQLETRVQRLQKLETIGTLTGGIAHDFNNLLTPIMGYTDMALLRLSVDDPLHKDLSQILNAAKRASDLVDQILLFSKQVEKDREQQDVHLVVEEALKLIRPSIPSTIEITLNIDSSCGKVLADATQIHQVIVNLCTNAWHAMEEGGVLLIELKPVEVTLDFARVHPRLHQGKYVCLTIADTGMGMDEATLEQIYEPFFTTKPVDKGTGMGMSVVHGIVDSHDGCIVVKSELGIGSEFNVYLPISQSVENSSEIVSTVNSMGQKSILIIDDDKAITGLMEMMLLEFGHQPDTYNCGQDALDAFSRSPENYDLLITDLTMPNLTGFGVLEAVQKFSPDFPTILMTGNSSESLENLRKGQVILPKPFTKHAVAVAIQEALIS